MREGKKAGFPPNKAGTVPAIDRLAEHELQLPVIWRESFNCA